MWTKRFRAVRCKKRPDMRLEHFWKRVVQLFNERATSHDLNVGVKRNCPSCIRDGLQFNLKLSFLIAIIWSNLIWNFLTVIIFPLRFFPPIQTDNLIFSFNFVFFYNPSPGLYQRPIIIIIMSCHRHEYL